MNDNAPKFELPDYQAHNVDEDIPLGTSILKVKAMDADSGKNAEIEYFVSGECILNTNLILQIKTILSLDFSVCLNI